MRSLFSCTIWTSKRTLKYHADIDDLCDDECQMNFRFFWNNIYNLTEVLDLADEIKCYNGLVVNKVEALAIFLKRCSYPCHYADMAPLFLQPIRQICMTTNNVTNFIHDRSRPWKIAFVDGTVRPIARPGKKQRVLYNSWYKIPECSSTQWIHSEFIWASWGQKAWQFNA